MFALAAFSLALLASQVSGYAVNVRSPLYALMRRETVDGETIPAQCQDVCAVSVNVANDPNCRGNPACICTPAVTQSFVGCINCGLSLTPSLVSEAQNELAQFSSFCAKAGDAVGSLTLSIPTGAASTGSASGTLFALIPSQTSSGAVLISAASSSSASGSTVSNAVHSGSAAGPATSGSAVSTAGASSPSGSGSSGQNKNGAVGRGGVSGLLVAGAVALLASAL